MSTAPTLRKTLRPSRSQCKRAVEGLQRLGERLATMPAVRWATLDLPEDLLAALKAYPGMRTREARRRQLQYIGALMRQLSPETIAAIVRLLGAWDLQGLVLGEVVESMHREG